MYYVYLLECKDKSIYAGITTDLKRRFKEHKEGKGGRYTRSRKAVHIIYSETYKTRGRALKREAEIKKMPRILKLKLVGKRPV